MQCKDIPDRPILEFLRDLPGLKPGFPRWATWGKTDRMPSVNNAMPAGIQGRLVLAKMRMLIRRGLVDGCDCGCRGDFQLTDKGREFLAVIETGG